MRMRGRTVGVLAPCEAHASRAREAGKGRPGRVAEAATERAGRRGREGGRAGGSGEEVPAFCDQPHTAFDLAGSEAQ